MNNKNKQINSIKKPELLAPAGNLEKMKTAFAFGADAVYLGIPDFSLRVRINDFDMAGIAEAVKYAHNLKKKVYVTVNIFAHNKHLDKLPPYIKDLKKIQVDALIISDPGVLALVKKIWPDCEIHLSTQANCTNWQSAKFWHEQGIKRIILGREVTFDEIKEIHKKASKVELECFIHGAMCMAYSGRCFLSKYFLNRSGNLGDCGQPCRWNFRIKNGDESIGKLGNQELGITATEPSPLRKGEIKRGFGELQTPNDSFILKIDNHPNKFLELVEEEHGSYILNSQDLCLIKHLDKLAEAGVSSFKIEGRAKSVYYLANVVGAYREAIDEITDNKRQTAVNLKKKLNYLYKELEQKLMHRGYTEGFMFGLGKLAQNLDNSHNQSEWEFCGAVIKALKQENIKTNSKYFVYIKVHNTLKVGDQIEILRPAYDIIKMKVKKMLDAKNNDEISEAHGGGKQVVILEVNGEVPEYSVLRRKVESKK